MRPNPISNVCFTTLYLELFRAVGSFEGNTVEVNQNVLFELTVKGPPFCKIPRDQQCGNYPLQELRAHQHTDDIGLHICTRSGASTTGVGTY